MQNEEGAVIHQKCEHDVKTNKTLHFHYIFNFFS